GTEMIPPGTHPGITRASQTQARAGPLKRGVRPELRAAEAIMRNRVRSSDGFRRKLKFGFEPGARRCDRYREPPTVRPIAPDSEPDRKPRGNTTPIRCPR